MKYYNCSQWLNCYDFVVMFDRTLLYTLIQKKNIYTQLSHYIHIIDIVNTIYILYINTEIHTNRLHL